MTSPDLAGGRHVRRSRTDLRVCVSTVTDKAPSPHRIGNFGERNQRRMDPSPNGDLVLMDATLINSNARQYPQMSIITHRDNAPIGMTD